MRGAVQTLRVTRTLLNSTRNIHEEIKNSFLGIRSIDRGTLAVEVRLCFIPISQSVAEIRAIKVPRASLNTMEDGRTALRSPDDLDNAMTYIFSSKCVCH